MTEDEHAARLQTLKDRLKELESESDAETRHYCSDQALIAYVNDPEVTAWFDNQVDRYCA